MAQEEEHNAATQPARFRRPPLERYGPARNAGQFMQADRPYARSPGAGDPAGPEAAAAGHSADGVKEGVRLGYEVIDEYLNQAKSTAQQFSPGVAPMLGRLGGLPKDVEKLADESMTFYRQMLDSWLRMLTSVGQQMLSPDSAPEAKSFWGAPQATGQQSSPEPQPLWQEEPLQATKEAANVALSVAAARPTRVSFELKHGADPLRMIVHPLRTLRADAEEIRDVQFRQIDGQLTLCVEVAAELEAGIYSGAIVDGANGSACGTVSVTLD